MGHKRLLFLLYIGILCDFLFYYNGACKSRVDIYQIIVLGEQNLYEIWMHAFVFKAKNISSVESQKGIIAVQSCSVKNEKGTIAVQSLWR